MFAIHSDNKGLVIPPKMAPNPVVIVPILFDDTKEKVIKKASEVAKILEKFEAFVDSRGEYSAGFKFNEWELKGIPLRIEIGPKDIERDSVVLVRRDNFEKEFVKIKDLNKKIPEVLESIQNNLFKKADKLLYGALAQAKNFDELKKALKEKKLVLTPLCKKVECEDKLKFETGGAKVLNIPEKQPVGAEKAKCVICGKKADYFAYVGKSY